MREYRLIRSERRSLSMSVEKDGAILVRAPMRMPKKDIDSFVASHEAWLKRAENRQRQRADFEETHFTDEAAIRRLTENAARILPALTDQWARKMDVCPTSVKITGAKTRFGSCSAKNGICYSYRLMAYPPEAWEYVVVHELAHIREKNHSPRFYAIIAQYLPDFRQREAMLRHRED